MIWLWIAVMDALCVLLAGTMIGALLAGFGVSMATCVFWGSLTSFATYTILWRVTIGAKRGNTTSMKVKGDGSE